MDQQDETRERANADCRSHTRSISEECRSDDGQECAERETDPHKWQWRDSLDGCSRRGRDGTSGPFSYYRTRHRLKRDASAAARTSRQVAVPVIKKL
jgi:hypothetical protein